MRSRVLTNPDKYPNLLMLCAKRIGNGLHEGVDPADLYFLFYDNKTVAFVSRDISLINWLKELNFNSLHVNKRPKSNMSKEVLDFVITYNTDMWSNNNLGPEYCSLENNDGHLQFNIDGPDDETICEFLQLVYYKGQIAQEVGFRIKHNEDIEIPNQQQQLLYLLKYNEAKEFMSTQYPENCREKFPFIYNESMLKGYTASSIAEEIIHKYRMMHDTIARFNHFKMTIFSKIKQASSLEQLDLIVKEFEDDYVKAAEL